MATLALGLTVVSSCAANETAMPTKTGHREGIGRIAGGDYISPACATNQAMPEPEPGWHSLVMPRKAQMPVIPLV